MKTAEDILMENSAYGFNEFTDSFTSVHKQHFLKAMKIYANQKIDLAIENCSIQDDSWNAVITTKELENLKDEL